jgi:hypothetical protein
MAGLLIRPRELRFVDRKLLGELLLAEPVADGHEITGALV